MAADAREPFSRNYRVIDRRTRRFIVTSLIQQMLGFWTPTEYKPYCQVRVAGEYVLLTASQARRYEELLQAKAAVSL